jgi:hypothetical protein
VDLAKWTFKLIDKPINSLVKRLVDTSVVEVSLPREKEFFLKKKKDGDPIEYINTMIGAIHGRASAAISHVSIMVGVTVILMARIECLNLIKFLMIAEVIIYSLILLLCLRCVRSMTLNDGHSHEIENIENVYDKEIIHRFSVLQLINSGLVVATVLFVVLIVSYGVFV